MRPLLRLLSLALLMSSSACVSVQVDPLTSASFEPRRGGEDVKTLAREPNHGYVQIARIVATSEYASEDTLRDRILSQAKELGADAVVLGEADVRRVADRGPVFQSTMGSAVSGANAATSYRSGYWNPFRMDAWSFSQGAGGGQSWMLHMSGLAIRYVSEDERRALDTKSSSTP
ncbi:hypothetical protein FBQ96_04085 [Nitrospirales bacterium NOB]|nr:MAG: hypothetical protein UZ03_NOB001002120 [Nitrospira sp. OLB3]MBV6470078.1 hypothetical protein [Nitrospirota bacterium]MCE7964973.1 hypothetical protein [Nitrospira sp. NTP2]MCK6492947.1 hypothetical protein [Nitrospira sp.]MDL1888753.1 hypothetical protein [Nitrospirales bacterium NOB]MEB2337957.1 hypothetical protein [Nitrospirales bacterium]